MRRRTLRRMLKWSLPVNVALLVLIFLDYFRWDSQGMAVLFVLYALLLVYLIIVLLLNDRAPWLRMRGSDEVRNTIVYPRRPHG